MSALFQSHVYYYLSVCADGMINLQQQLPIVNSVYEVVLGDNVEALAIAFNGGIVLDELRQHYAVVTLQLGHQALPFQVLNVQLR